LTHGGKTAGFREIQIRIARSDVTESRQDGGPDMEEIVSPCKRRGFIFQSSDLRRLAGAWATALK
jgi:hypothetical protein